MTRRPAAPQVHPVLPLAVAFVVAAACSSAARSGTNAPAQALPIVLTYEVPVVPESAYAAARFALGAVEGFIQMPQVRPKFTTISTHYIRDRRGGGQRQVAIIIAVDRASTRRDSVSVTAIELRAFALDMAQQPPRGQRRSSFPQTALSTNAPAQRTPRPVTPADTLDWYALQLVAQSLEAKGAQRIP